MGTMYCSFYLRNGTAFIPTMAKTEAGYWMGIEPVDVQKVEVPEALQTLLMDAVKRGNPVVPTPKRDKFPRALMERRSGLKSLSAFERTASCWADFPRQRRLSHLRVATKRTVSRFAGEGRRDRSHADPRHADRKSHAAGCGTCYGAAGSAPICRLRLKTTFAEKWTAGSATVGGNSLVTPTYHSQLAKRWPNPRIVRDTAGYILAPIDGQPDRSPGRRTRASPRDVLWNK